jgi:hypothetical protein
MPELKFGPTSRRVEVRPPYADTVRTTRGENPAKEPREPVSELREWNPRTNLVNPWRNPVKELHE